MNILYVAVLVACQPLEMLCNQCNNSIWTSDGGYSTAETVWSAEHDDGGGGDGGGGDGGVEGGVRGQEGVLGFAASALWEMLPPFVDGKYADGTGGSWFWFIFSSICTSMDGGG